MRYVRWLIPLVLLIVAAPAFALCGLCDQLDNCNHMPGLGVGCHYRVTSDCTVLCIEDPNPGCYGGGGFTFSNEYRITSVTVSDAKATAIGQKRTAAVPRKVKKT